MNEDLRISDGTSANRGGAVGDLRWGRSAEARDEAEAEDEEVREVAGRG